MQSGVFERLSKIVSAKNLIFSCKIFKFNGEIKRYQKYFKICQSASQQFYSPIFNRSFVKLR